LLEKANERRAAREQLGNCITMADVTLEQAHTVIDAAHKKASELGVAVSIAVLDSGANLKAFARMEGALLGATDIALRKARTAALFHMESGDLPSLAKPGGHSYGVEESNGGLVLLHGGVPLTTAAGEVLGAIGISGATEDLDHATARAGAEAIT
jgi:uncharacterized protein GlcG (DUF336 family)